ncbi:LysR family transcriptional regulator [Cupriavidus necator]|uniref:LysR family transcriptional regulator n=1 Tax=Cupriavidus necator TaxID=106590 RepID=UPI000A4E5B12|nr:LysR family transcriptional regulator [Cupriavidus necator]
MQINFDLTDLRLFLAVADEQNLTRGAHRVFLSPSAASSRIRKLEEHTSAPLFYRNLQGLELTALGTAFHRHARLVLRQVDLFQDEFDVDGSGAGRLRIFANTTAVTEFMPEILARFMAKRPGITVDMLERVTADIVNGVLEETADIGIVAGPIAQEGLQVIPFSSDNVVLVTPQSHPLSAHHSVRYVDVLDYPQIGLHEGSSMLSFVRDVARQHGKPLKVRIQVRSFEAMCCMAEAGVGVALVPESAALRHQEQMKLCVVPVQESWAVRQRSIVVRELNALSLAGRSLIEDICAAYSNSTRHIDRAPGMVFDIAA